MHCLTFRCYPNQALEDAANFLVTYNATLDRPGPWVVFGCSYSGALSSWFRAKYPDLVVASIAPSGPVEAQSNYTSFFGQYSRSAAPDCVDATATAVQKIASMMKTEAGRTSLASTFNACEPLAEEVRGWGGEGWRVACMVCIVPSSHLHVHS